MDKKPLQVWCSLLGVSRQAYYDRLEREGIQAVLTTVIINAVLEIRAYLPKSGFRQLQYELKDLLAEHNIGRDKFLQMLRQAGLLQQIKRGGTRTTFSAHGLFVYQNLIDNLLITNILQVWVVDITYIRTTVGFVYLALVTDSFSRKIVGYDASDSLELEGSLRALQQAVKGIPKKIKHSLIHHSDRGSQYCSHVYIQYLCSQGIRISMAATGNCYENPQAESMNGRLKVEFLLDSTFPSKQAAYTAIANAVLMYNTKRPHGRIAGEKPTSLHQAALDALLRKEQNEAATTSAVGGSRSEQS